jgi:four helix bundle protein
MSTSGNLVEADEASSRADFVVRMKIALREARESALWLRLLLACGLPGHSASAPLLDEARQLALIFAAIIRNTKRNSGQ